MSEQPQQTHDATPQYTAAVHAFPAFEARDTDTAGERNSVAVMDALVSRDFLPVGC